MAMKSYGLEIHLNDTFLCRAGFENTYYGLHCIIGSLRRKLDESEDLSMNVSGLNSETEQHYDWINTKLKDGDKISIKVISDTFDRPSKISEQYSKEFMLEKKLKYFHKLKEELKDYLTDEGGK